MKTKGHRICGWCGEDRGPAETERDTHDICGKCRAIVEKDADEEIERLLAMGLGAKKRNANATYS